VTFERDKAGEALLGGVRLAELFRSGELTTPAYVYDLDAMRSEARDLIAGFGASRHLVAFAVKANSAGPVIRALGSEGCGADVVSGAELELAEACGIVPERIVFSGVAKLDSEIDLAITRGQNGILAIQVESVEEIPRIEARARAVRRRARISMRINPGIEAETHAYIATGHDEAKFGIPKSELERAIDALRDSSHVDLVGISSHIGSQLTSTDAYLTAARMLLPLATVCEAALERSLSFIDFGGGFGVDYGPGCPVKPRDFAMLVRDLCREARREDLQILVEPGRSMVAVHGVLCATVIMEKCARPSEATREWLMIDAGMNDLLRPALYQAFHRIEPIEVAPPPLGEGRVMRVVGPVCESSDDFGNHAMPRAPVEHVVIRDAGAYGFTMASEYNGRALPTEIFLEGGKVSKVIAPRPKSEWIRTRLG
jgi:diaminopimelate decarboxylase